MRILVEWYFNELLIMLFTSIRVIANDKNKPEMCFYAETATKRNKMILNNSIFKSYYFNEIELVTHIIECNGQNN